MVEHAAVNRVVVGSSPTSGANCFMFGVHILGNPAGRFYTGRTESCYCHEKSPVRLAMTMITVNTEADGR